MGEHLDLPSVPDTDLMRGAVASVVLATPIPVLVAKFGNAGVVRNVRFDVGRLMGSGGWAPTAKEQVPGAVHHGL